MARSLGIARSRLRRGLGGGGSAPVVVPDASYVSGFFMGANYATGAAASMTGSGAHTFFVAFISRTNTATGALMAKANSAAVTTGGWSFRKTLAGACEFRVRDGVGTKVAPSYSLVAGDVNKIVMLHGVIDITTGNVIRMYRQGVEVGSGTATSGAFTSSANDLGIGSRNGGNESIGSDCDIVGAGGTDAAMSGAQIAAHYAACVAANAVVAPTPGTTKRVWSAASYASPWLDSVASSSLTVTGTLTASTLSPTTWAT